MHGEIGFAQSVMVGSILSDILLVSINLAILISRTDVYRSSVVV